jgi:hypothetical protein
VSSVLPSTFDDEEKVKQVFWSETSTSLDDKPLESEAKLFGILSL